MSRKSQWNSIKLLCSAYFLKHKATIEEGKETWVLKSLSTLRETSLHSLPHGVASLKLVGAQDSEGYPHVHLSTAQLWSLNVHHCDVSLQQNWKPLNYKGGAMNAFLLKLTKAFHLTE